MLLLILSYEINTNKISANIRTVLFPPYYSQAALSFGSGFKLLCYTVNSEKSTLHSNSTSPHPGVQTGKNAEGLTCDGLATL